MSAELQPETIESLNAKAAMLEAQAKLKSAEALLKSNSSSLWEKIVVRGVIPIALLVAGPMATFYFSNGLQEAQTEVRAVAESAEKLEDLVQAQEAEASTMRARFQEIEEQKAVELKAMSTVVRRLDQTLRASMVQLTVMQIITEQANESNDGMPMRDDVLKQAAQQISIPGIDEEEVTRIADQTYNRFEARKGGK